MVLRRLRGRCGVIAGGPRSVLDGVLGGRCPGRGAVRMAGSMAPEKNQDARVRDARERIAREQPKLSDFVRRSGREVLVEEEASQIVADSKVDGKTFFVETLGCQMNVADSEIVNSILLGAGYEWTEDPSAADVVLLNTCAIREHAEDKAIQRLQTFRKRAKHGRRSQTVGVLGCMAERMKERLFDKGLVDVVAGPDAYRSLPSLLLMAKGDEAAIDVHLSLDETYADVAPVRIGPGWQAYISISRGCNNMCTYCIVPFTRGRERSRDIESIVREVEAVSAEGTVREITLLGQNVNSYHYKDRGAEQGRSDEADTYKIAPGFTDLYKARRGGGYRFHDLLDRVASVDPSIRIRFTSPHPKDFTDEVLHVIKKHDNICKGIHLPVQSGSDNVLKAMRRGYTRQAYLDLVGRARQLLGDDLELSSDFISGFCGETEEDHQETLSLVKQVGFEQAFMFAYSQRAKTRAYHRLEDDVTPETKARRLQEVISAFRETATEKAQQQVGKVHTVLVEGPSKRSPELMQGRTNGLRRCIILPDGNMKRCKPGDYVNVQVVEANLATLKGKVAPDA